MILCDTVRVQHCDTVMLQQCDTVTVQYCDTVMLQHCDTVWLQYCDTVTLQHCDNVRVQYPEAIRVRKAPMSEKHLSLDIAQIASTPLCIFKHFCDTVRLEGYSGDIRNIL